MYEEGNSPGAQATGLRAVLEDAIAEDGRRLKDLTVLAVQNDPFRVDTPAGHRDGEWLAMHAEKLGERRIHLRGLHYMVLGEPKPDGSPYTNTDPDWLWLQSKAGKAARWLGYIPFDKITDERNSPPVIRTFERPEPARWISVGEVEVGIPEDLEPRVELFDFRPVQPYKLVLFGEKTSLEDVLAPIAESRQADLYLPTGEASDTMIHQMAKEGAADGRKMIVFYLSDCDPAGHQMAISVARKLQACKALDFNELEFEVRPIALTPDQVREHGLPSTPLKDTERRASRWTQAMGVEQTEIDALATLRPDLLAKIVRDAIKPFYDTGLEERVREVRREWRERAQAVLVARIGEKQLRQLRAEGEAKLDELVDEVEAINDALRVELPDGISLPEIPEIPEAQVRGADGLPLIDSGWDWVDQTMRLIAHKSYIVDKE
ncbi:MAG: hypothetical protein ACRDGE_07945 [Candidatus Limnocylindria bacterium]